MIRTGSPIEVEGRILTSKGQKKKYQGQYGTLEISRHVYQSSEGSQIYVPLDKTANILHGSTPKFTRCISSKYGFMSTRQIVSDLSENHG